MSKSYENFLNATIFNLEHKAEELRAENAALKEQSRRESVAFLTIAVSCLCTGLIPRQVEGTVEAVRIVCKEVERLKEELTCAQKKLKRKKL